MEPSVPSSPSINQSEKSNPSLFSNVDWEDMSMVWEDAYATKMEVENEFTSVGVEDWDQFLKKEKECQKPEGDASSKGSQVGLLSITSSAPTPILCDYTEHFTTNMVFATDEELVDWVKCTGKRHGFVIVIKASEKHDLIRKPRMRFACERSGKYRKFAKKSAGEETVVKKRLRSTATKKCECPFELRSVRGNEGWSVVVHNGTHNHPRAEYMEGHAYAGRLSKEQTASLVDLSVSLVKPKEILTQMKIRDPTNSTTIKTVYNARHKYRVSERAGRSQMQYLMAKLQEHGYINWHRTNEAGIITDLFWSPPKSIEMLLAFPQLLLMDSTYKTNRYRFPLLQIVGVTSTEFTFSAAFALMESEKEEHYTWVLEKLKGMMEPELLPAVIVTDRELALMNAISKVFPHATHLLCRWHISRNIAANCKKLFDGKKWEEFIASWNLLVRSTSVAQYEERLFAFRVEFGMFPTAVDYVQKSWLAPYKERFVGAWTDKVMHFGNLTSNRVEGQHSTLKTHLKNSKSEFDTVWKHIDNLMTLQVTEVKGSFEKSLSCWQHDFKITLFEKLRGFVSKAALNHVLETSSQVEMYLESNKECECSIRHTHGLPCAHEIAPYKAANIPLPLELIHDHWKRLSLVPALPRINPVIAQTVKADLDHLYTNFLKENLDRQKVMAAKVKELARPVTTQASEPLEKARTRGRKTNKEKLAEKQQSSTRRDPSKFEHVEASLQTPKAVKEQPRRNPRAKVKVRGQQFTRFHFTNQFPEAIRPYIMSVNDVKSDGNCGFRTISAFMNDGDEDKWMAVRHDLLKELEDNQDLYKKLAAGYDRVSQLHHMLSCFDSPAPKDKWMTMPDMGHLIASAYNCVLIHLSRKQCLTFLPLCSKPIPALQRKVIAIGFVDGGHFVQVFLKSNSPIPPIACNWTKYHLPVARNWDKPYVARIQNFKDIIGNNVATKETIYVE